MIEWFISSKNGWFNLIQTGTNFTVDDNDRNNFLQHGGGSIWTCKFLGSGNTTQSIIGQLLDVQTHSW